VPGGKLLEEAAIGARAVRAGRGHAAPDRGRIG
jgi:hypothetical protein